MFGAYVQELFADDSNIKVEVHDRKWIEQKKMGAFLSVAAGSHEEPKFIEITYKNADDASKPFVFVGKGVTFDTGGISLKPSKGMPTMRADMGGAACIIGAMHAVSKMALQINMKCLIPCTDNMPSSKATRPGDVVTAMNGKTIAVDNTDAEGRLILADALCYSGCFNPKFVIDMATLTGAIGVALGKGAVGVYSNTHALYDILQEAGARTGDRVWRMPLWKLYTKLMTDCTAYDLQNVAEVGGGSCTAAGFLREFAPKDVDWMHIDIAGVMDGAQPMKYVKGMSGRPTRTIIEFIVMNQ
ncbi:cytosol aminopeptidase-like [Atheta coriaria]|uniref:cytosol aminopeptidase-like n=1 Tax=Dalotia coriaria TaxID=877792 RepID=UPI0031F46D92